MISFVNKINVFDCRNAGEAMKSNLAFSKFSVSLKSFEKIEFPVFRKNLFRNSTSNNAQNQMKPFTFSFFSSHNFPDFPIVMIEMATSF